MKHSKPRFEVVEVNGRPVIRDVRGTVICSLTNGDYPFPKLAKVMTEALNAKYGDHRHED